MLTFYIISIFPEVFANYFNESIIGRAQKEKKIKINYIDLRDYADDKYKHVDDTPYGGGAGMVMMVEPIYKAVIDVKKRITKSKSAKGKIRKVKTFLFAAKGEKYNQQLAQKFTKLDDIILICGRYEGIDERVSKYIADEEISIGEYVLTGGEIPAMVFVDSVSRLLPGVLGNKESLENESFSKPDYREYPHYTRPASFKNKSSLISKTKCWKVPKVLLSGNHQKIEEWRQQNSEENS